MVTVFLIIKLAALPQNTMWPAPRPTEAAFSTSSAVKTEPSNLAPSMEFKFVPISRPTHFPEP